MRHLALLGVLLFLDSSPTDSGKLPQLPRNYRSWSDITDGASPVPIFLWIQCARQATPDDEQVELRKHGPHARAYTRVFANSRAAVPLRDRRGEAVFPDGSIIVKEKLLTPTDATPVGIGVMTKRKRGFNPTSGDWEYSYFENGRSVPVGESCQSCHNKRASEGHVFRSYLR